jgi:hypothetical protein
MSFSLVNLTNLANTALEHFIKSDPVEQNVQDKPMLDWLHTHKKEFPGGNDYVSGPVQGDWLADQAGFFGWYSHADQVTFARPDNILRAKYQWREWHVGAQLDFTDLKQHGIVVDASGNPVKSSDAEIQIVKDWIETVLVNDVGESINQALWNAFWGDGTSSAKAVVGLLGLLGTDPTVGTIGNLNRATYDWWRHRVDLAIPYSPANQTLTKGLRNNIRQQRRYGGKPDVIFAGSDAIEAMEAEVHEKGVYTQSGFAKEGTNDIGMSDILIRGVGKVQYEPYLDDNGLSGEIFILDSRHLKLMPMKGAYMQSLKVTRPYDQMVVLKSVVGTCAISMDKANCHGRYRVA